MRYEGQGHELDVSLTPATATTALARAFASAHEARFGFTLGRPIEIVSVRSIAQGKARRARFGTVRARQGRPVMGPRAIALPDATLYVARGWQGRKMPSDGWSLERP
jgi:N-methylhydantoinase A/oxoprolinase/acetone carboxylase beta subunit